MKAAINRYCVRCIPEEDVKFYVAHRCRCWSWMLYGPAAVDVPKQCFFCGRQWVMDEEGKTASKEATDEATR